MSVITIVQQSKQDFSIKSKHIDLGNSILKHPLPEKLLLDLSKELKNVNLYPSGGGYINLRKILSRYVGTNEENVLPTNGSDEAIEVITRAFGKDLVLIPIPTFSQYEVSADRNGFKKKLVPCFQNSFYQLAYSKDDLKKASLIWVCNPNNPTGTTIPREEITKILSTAPGIVVVDECYFEFLGETVLDLMKENPNLVIIRSFSKNFGIAGLRLGFIISNTNIIGKIKTFVQNFGVNRIAEKAAQAVLKYLPYYEEAWYVTKEIRDDFVEQINKIGFQSLDSHTNFVLVNFKEKEVAEYYWEKLKKNNIHALPGWNNEFSGLPEHYIRFTIGEKWEMDKVLSCFYK